MTTKAQDAVIDGMADDGTVFVKPLEINGRVYSTVRVCVLAENGERVSPWSLIAEDGVVLTLREERDERVATLLVTLPEDLPADEEMT
jgi:leucyl aminopeptidase (aminopeptidase T)